MTTINNIEDLVRLLDERPQWLDAVRARVLTRELIELPQTLARFAAGTNEHFAEVDQQFDKVDQRFDKVDQRIDKVEGEMNERFDKVDQRFDKVEGEMNERFDKVDQRFDKVEGEMNERFDKVEGDISGLRNDIAPLKGAHVRSAAVREAGLIAEDMGFALVQTLTSEQVRTLSQSVSTADIPAGDLRSFRRADLIMEVTDGEGETCYVAVEISFTANGRDTTRAVRNAGFLTAFTGKRSVAAVAGLRRDDRIDESIESGEVFWHQLDPSDLEAE